MSYILSSSILTARMAELGSEVDKMLKAGIDQIHLDIMDNHFVPNLTFGPWICHALQDYGINAEFDVHLMTNPVEDLIFRFADAGAKIITIHQEAVVHLDRALNRIRELGVQAGVAINPATGINTLEYILELCDEVLIMSVNPGFGGQQNINYCLNKVTDLHDLINKHKYKTKIAVDGGISAKNIKQYASAGASKFIMGSALYSSPDYPQAVKELRKILNDVAKLI